MPEEARLEKPSRPSGFEDRYRLYLDESGDHVYRQMADLPHRFLCLLGCWFRNPDYLRLHEALEDLKARHLPHHPDEPVVLHREEMLNSRSRPTFRGCNWLTYWDIRSSNGCCGVMDCWRRSRRPLHAA